MPSRDKTDAQSDYESVSRMADRMKLKGRARTDYIHKHMTTLGHRAVINYVEADDDDESDGGGFFGSSKRRNRDDDDDDYPFSS
jgi:hypothetical protein